LNSGVQAGSVVTAEDFVVAAARVTPALRVWAGSVVAAETSMSANRTRRALLVKVDEWANKSLF